jgi:hypothetical protein
VRGKSPSAIELFFDISTVAELKLDELAQYFELKQRVYELYVSWK